MRQPPIVPSPKLVDLADAAKDRDAQAFARLFRDHSIELIMKETASLPAAARKLFHLLFLPIGFSSAVLLLAVFFDAMKPPGYPLVWLVILITSLCVSVAILLFHVNNATAQINDDLQVELTKAQTLHPELRAWVEMALTRSNTSRITNGEWRFLKLSLLNITGHGD